MELIFLKWRAEIFDCVQKSLFKIVVLFSRGPVSLSRMGERLSLQLSAPLPSKKLADTSSSSESPYRLRASSLAGSKSNIPQLIRNPPRQRAALPANVPTAVNTMSPRKQSRFSSTSSSSPEHSKLNPSSASSNSSQVIHVNQSFLSGAKKVKTVV